MAASCWNRNSAIQGPHHRPINDSMRSALEAPMHGMSSFSLPMSCRHSGLPNEEVGYLCFPIVTTR